MEVKAEKTHFYLEISKKLLLSNFLFYCVIFLFVLKISTVLVSINFPQNIFFADVTKSALENFVNQTRQSVGLSMLSENQKLNQAAQLKAENMTQNNYFAHTSPSGISPWFWFSKAGYNYKYAGENLAIGFFESNEVYQAWLNSPSHKVNILNPNYTEFGTAVVYGFGENNAVIVVQEFASPQISKKIAVEKTIVEKNPTVQEETIIPTGEKVLSQSIEAPKTHNYNLWVQNIIYGFSMFVIGILAIIMLNNIGKGFKKELVFRTVVLVVLLSFSMLLNSGIIVYLIPHQITI